MKKITLAAAALLALLASCSSNAATTTPDAASSEAGQLQTLTPGKLTVATGLPAYEPWVMNDDPESGEGYEAALAYAIAEKLGFAKEDVVWTRTSFEEAIQPGPKNFDLNLQQYSILDDRRQVVDLSVPYYKEPFAVVAPKSNKFASAKTVKELRDAKFGAASGDISYDVTQETFEPAQEVASFNDLAAVTQAMNSGQIDALVVGITTADYMVSAGEVEDGVVVGIIAGSEDRTQGMGALLEKDSPLTAAVDEAITAFTNDGTLESLQKKWLGQYDYPTFG
ncbi:MAG: transporter substrate-binding domain-containing protein [Propionibacteriaceae bacterium]|jgi:polar amino acid transport system substrate-binding protein|nr:transporter substrate-binding domain-containing protein [Propionibacteriaceae bacterium]